MKPNLLIVHPPHVGNAQEIDLLCEKLAGDYFVYLLRPCSESRDDSAGGVRFLSHPLTDLPRFGYLNTVISIGEPGLFENLVKVYPEADHVTWTKPACQDLMALLRRKRSHFKVIDGGQKVGRHDDLAKAI